LLSARFLTAGGIARSQVLLANLGPEVLTSGFNPLIIPRSTRNETEAGQAIREAEEGEGCGARHEKWRPALTTRV
jgi:hypothetical protein